MSDSISLTSQPAGGPLQERQYAYKMVQIAPSLIVNARDVRGQEAATYLEGVVNEWSAAGWEFYRVDTMSIYSPPGCLGALFGGQTTLTNYYVVTFRRLR